MIQVLAESYFDWAQKAGTFPMQVLLLLGIVGIGIAFKKFYRDTNLEIAGLVDRIEKRDANMTAERLQRIQMLMDVIRDDAKAKADVAHAVENNTDAINELRRVIANHKL